MIIKSRENKLYKMCKSLSLKKFRDKLGLYVVEGEKLVLEAIDKGKAFQIICNYEKNLEDGYKKDGHVFMEGKLFKELTHTETDQGIIAVVRKDNLNFDEFLKVAEDKNLLVLDRLQDPGNVGTILRTADAAGYGGIIGIKGTVDFYSPKVVRAAANSLIRVPIFMAESEDEAISIATKANCLIVGSNVGKELTNYRPLKEKDIWKFDRNIALVLGNEGGGVSRRLLEKCHITTKIPMKSGVDSLNASVAAGILVYELGYNID